MFRPERMSRVSVTGTKAVMTDVVETVHDLHLLHVSEYDGGWDGFSPGDPVEGADEAAEKLVTVRSLESILDVDGDDAGPTRLVTDEALETELEELRRRVNELDDRRDELADQLRSVEEDVGAMEPFAALGIDLDLLTGYDTIDVAVGEGDAETVRSALADADAVDAFELFAGDGVVAAFARPAEDAPDDALPSALVGVRFEQLEVPDLEAGPVDVDEAGTAPETYLDALEARRVRLESKLETVESELEDQKLEAAGFLLAAEEKLSIDVRKREAPLNFATTEHAFVAEGWLPTGEVDRLRTALSEAVGDRIEVEELARAAYDAAGHPATDETVAEEPPRQEAGDEAAPGTGEGATAGADADAGDEAADREAVTDGGHATMSDEPPVLQSNPGVVEPFEVLTRAVGRPNYSELDPTVVLFLTFPAMFGFMIGDVGYGLVYTAIGFYLYTTFDADSLRNAGLVTIAAGLLTALFGALFGEIFGLHLVTDYVWDPLLGGPPLKKGLSPAEAEWANVWFVVTAIFGVLHLETAYLFEFVEDWELHGPVDAVLETGSWLLALNGLWLFIFSRWYAEPKPALLFEVFDEGAAAAFPLGFDGLPVVVGQVGLVMVVAGAVLMLVGPAHEIMEFHFTLAHPLSYLRISAELLAEVGLAFAVNLLFWGAYEHEGEFHFMLSHGREYVVEHHPGAEIMFPGLVHGGVVAVAFGVVLLVVGHLVVLALGVLSVGIQAIRLEYFEFFSKFYEGGGTPYTPFGTERRYTAEE